MMPVPPGFDPEASDFGERSSPYISAAIAIGEQLLASSVPAPGGLTWEGDDLIGSDETDLRLVHGPVGSDLYAGAAGISWFLGHLAAETASAEFADTAIAGLQFALTDAVERLEDNTISLYSGAAGVALAGTEVADRLRQPELAGMARSLALQIVDIVGTADSIDETDLIGGLAGVALALLALHRRYGDEALLEGCRSACRTIVERSRSEWWGVSWPEEEGWPALCGLAHGTSGIGWAMAEVAWATGDMDLLSVAEGAFRYERSLFSRERCAWPDLRKPTYESLESGRWPGWTTAWCHGALGIGAVRLRLYEVSPNSAALAEASAAIQAARFLVVQSARHLHQGVTHDVTLCHGLGGVTELILLAAEVLDSEDHRLAANRVGELCLRIFEANGRRWPYGLPHGERVPGLFLGLAGIGVTMMRLHDPSSIGSPILPGRLPRQPGTYPRMESQ